MEEFLKQWDNDIDNPETNRNELYEKMLKLFNENYNENDNNNIPDDKKKLCAEYCWRLIYICLILSDLELKKNNKNQSKKWEEDAFKYANIALKLDDKSMNVHKWYCAAVGRMAPHVSTKERIQMGHQFKEHRDIACSINNDDALMHHMYGRWCWEVANLSFVERQLAKTFFGAPPQSSYDEAIESLKMADKIKPNWKNNYNWIAKVLISKKDYKEAIKWIDLGLKLPNLTEEDGVAQKELETFEKSYAKYR